MNTTRSAKKKLDKKIFCKHHDGGRAFVMQDIAAMLAPEGAAIAGYKVTSDNYGNTVIEITIDNTWGVRNG